MFKLKAKLKAVIKKIVPSSMGTKIANIWVGEQLISYSQEGEDLILNRIFEGRNNGFYIDVGAHHPTRFSNTYFFYKKGWRGVNIDAMPDSMSLFNLLRAEDINLEFAVFNENKTLKFYIFNEPALNTFSEEEALLKNGMGVFKIVNTLELTTKRLDDILNKCDISPDKKIDFLSIDVEGLDLAVLESNNWDKYRPQVVLVEALDLSLETLNESKVFLFMKEKNYTLFAKTFNTMFFITNE